LFVIVHPAALTCHQWKTVCILVSRTWHTCWFKVWFLIYLRFI